MLAKRGGTSPTTNAWSIDQSTGKVNVSFFGDINLQGNAVLDVGRITGYLGKWRIDEEGTLMAVRVVTEEVIANTLKAKKGSFTDKLEVGTPEKPIGVTIYDKTTTDAYCMYIDQGAIRAVKGACEDSSSAPRPPPPPPEEPVAPPPPPPPSEAPVEDASEVEVPPPPPVDQSAEDASEEEEPSPPPPPPPAETPQESPLPAPESSSDDLTSDADESPAEPSNPADEQLPLLGPPPAPQDASLSDGAGDDSAEPDPESTASTGQ